MSSKKFEIAKKIVEAGNSKVFNDWQSHIGCTQEEFLRELEWVYDDPFTAEGRVTRAMGIDKDGKICRLRYAYSAGGSFVGVYHMDGLGMLYGSSRYGSVRITSRDHI